MKIIKKLLLSTYISIPLLAFACNLKEPQVIKEPFKPDPSKDKKTQNKPLEEKMPEIPILKNNINDKKDVQTSQTHEPKKVEDKIGDPAPNKEEELIKELQEMYEVMFRIYEPFTKTGVFSPKEWLEEDQETIKEQYKQERKGTFNITFFNNYPPYLEDIENERRLEAQYIRITTKDQFDTYIVQRFKELNKSNDFNQNSQIKKLFEELYLNNQDVYEILNENDIFIKKVSGNYKNTDGGFIIPIYDDKEVTITYLGFYHAPDPSEIVAPTVYLPDPSRIWEVFLIKKDFAVKYRFMLRDVNTTTLEFRNEIADWYKNKFLNKFS